jgi:hypothetical protein
MTGAISNLDKKESVRKGHLRRCTTLDLVITILVKTYSVNTCIPT